MDFLLVAKNSFVILFFRARSICLRARCLVWLRYWCFYPDAVGFSVLEFDVALV